MNDEEVILFGLIDWVNEILPDLTCEIKHYEYEGGYDCLEVRGASRLVQVTIEEDGLKVHGKVISWTRSDIRREFQRLVLVAVSRADPNVMLNNQKFYEAWQHIITQDVSR